jgi:hypothetical protein
VLVRFSLGHFSYVERGEKEIVGMLVAQLLQSRYLDTSTSKVSNALYSKLETQETFISGCETVQVGQ